MSNQSKAFNKRRSSSNCRQYRPHIERLNRRLNQSRLRQTITASIQAAILIGSGFALSAQALPTPLLAINSGALADDAPLLAYDNTQLANDSRLNPNVTLTNHTISKNETPVTASESEQLLATWREQAKQNKLAEHITWRRLLYYLDDQETLFGSRATESLIENPEFFLTPTGKYDPKAELDAMLAAFAVQITTSQITMPQMTTSKASAAICQFPARTQWLAMQLNIDETRLHADCPELRAWMQRLNPDQLSIMFAEEYLDKPISAFAHTLLRIDSPTSAQNPSQIDQAYALNDTVDGDPDDPFLLYALKSTTGSYDNRIEIDPYHEKLANYLQIDERDAWTYQLNLTPAEVQQIILHVWETKDLHIPYYFTTDNCASEILRLIDVIRPNENLLNQLPYVVVPSDVIQLLNRENLLVNARFTPSDATVRQAELNKAHAAAQLGYQSLSQDQAARIASADRNHASAISANGQKIVDHGILPSNNNPIDRHPLQVGEIGIGRRGDNSYLDLGVRLGFHDNLDRVAGYSQFFALEGLAATLRVYDTDSGDNNNNEPDDVVLQNFTLLRGRSFNPINTAKEGNTWGVSVEATRVNDGSQEEGGDHLVGSAAYEKGVSWAFGTARKGTGEMPPQLCYALATGSAQAGRGITNGYRLGVGVNAGCLYRINNQLRAQAELQLPYWYHGDSSVADVKSHYWQPVTTLGLQYDINRKQALRLDASFDWQDRVDANDDVKLAYRRYF